MLSVDEQPPFSIFTTLLPGAIGTATPPRRTVIGLGKQNSVCTIDTLSAGATSLLRECYSHAARWMQQSNRANRGEAYTPRQVTPADQQRHFRTVHLGGALALDDIESGACHEKGSGTC